MVQFCNSHSLQSGLKCTRACGAGVFLNQERTWFLKIDPVVRIVGMRVCVSTPEAINN